MGCHSSSASWQPADSEKGEWMRESDCSAWLDVITFRKKKPMRLSNFMLVGSPNLTLQRKMSKPLFLLIINVL